MEKQYDAIVIGAGNGGLVSAIRILMAGKSCLLLEKHNLPGGFATSFVRGRFEFEASLHELCDFGSKEEPGDVRALFRDIGVEDKIEWVRINDAYHLSTIDGKYEATMPFGIKAFIDKMEHYVPDSRPSLENFFEIAQEIRQAQNYIASMKGNADSKVLKSKHSNFLKSGSYKFNEVLETLKMPQKARDILSAYWCYLGVDLDHLNFLHYSSLILRYVDRFAWMPKMKSHEMSLALDQRIRELGGDIWYNSEAEKILSDANNNIVGVRLTDGKELATKHIVANCSPHVVYGKMMDKNMIPEREIKATNARRFAGRGYTLYLGLNKSCDELGIKHHNYFIYDTADTAKQYESMKKFETNNGQATVCLNRADPTCSPKGTTMMYFTTMFMEDVWGDITEEEYYKKKDEVANKMIDVFEKQTNTKIRDCIEEIAIASPMTYARYCGHPQGVIYGYEVYDWDTMIGRLMMLNEDYQIKGLRFAGGYGLRSSGYSSAFISGDIIGKKTISDIKSEV